MGDDERVESVAFSPDGSLLHTLESETDYYCADGLAFSPDGRLLAVAGARSERERVVKVWTVSDGRLDKALELPREAKDVVFSPDGRWLAAGSPVGITLWEMPDGILRATLDHVTEAEETDWVTSVAFSPDSTLLAAGRWIGILEALPNRGAWLPFGACLLSGPGADLVRARQARPGAFDGTQV